MKNKIFETLYCIYVFAFLMILVADIVDGLLYRQKVIPDSLRMPLFLIYLLINDLHLYDGRKSKFKEISDLSRGK